MLYNRRRINIKTPDKAAGARWWFMANFPTMIHHCKTTIMIRLLIADDHAIVRADHSSSPINLDI